MEESAHDNMNQNCCPPSGRCPQVITPSLPLSAEYTDEPVRDMAASPNAGEHRSETQNIAPVNAESAFVPHVQVAYSVPPPPQRIGPAESVQDLYEPMADSSDPELASSSYSPDIRVQSELHGEVPTEEHDSQDEVIYQPGFLPNASTETWSVLPQSALAASSSRSASQEILPGSLGAVSTPRNRMLRAAGREGQTSTSAILIPDSPTPPLRPLASSEARLAISATGRCGARTSSATSNPASSEAQGATLGELVCPICLGPPSPLVVTECGHTL